MKASYNPKLALRNSGVTVTNSSVQWKWLKLNPICCNMLMSRIWWRLSSVGSWVWGYPMSGIFPRFFFSVSRGKGAGSSVSQTRLTLSKRGCYTCSLSTECTLANKFSEMNSKQRHFGISCATTCCRWKMMLQMLRWWSKHILDFQGLFLMVSCRLVPTHAIRGQCSLQRHCIPCKIYLAKTHWQPRPNILQQ